MATQDVEETPAAHLPVRPVRPELVEEGAVLDVGDRANVEFFPDYEAPSPLIIPALWPEMVALNGGKAIETHA